MEFGQKYYRVTTHRAHQGTRQSFRNYVFTSRQTMPFMLQYRKAYAGRKA